MAKGQDPEHPAVAQLQAKKTVRRIPKYLQPVEVTGPEKGSWRV
jgi:hypothetical protein